MRIGRRETKRRLIGFTLPTVLGTGGGGATFANEQGDRSRAQSALHFLEDHQVLYNPYDVELPYECISSVQHIRGYLLGLISECDSPELGNPLRAIQAACRQFLTDVKAIELRGFPLDIQRSGTGSWLFNQALGALRARVGTSVAVIVQTFDIDVDEHLAPIMPPPVEDGDSDTPELETYQPDYPE